MSSHYHLVVETPNGNLSRGMPQFNGFYTTCFNRGHGSVGHLVLGRYKAILAEANPRTAENGVFNFSTTYRGSPQFLFD